MELGEKLRQARLEAGLSQRQLCGQVITRNMLSQIESGKAKPSMSTLQYLAGQLGKSVGFFLDEDFAASANIQTMARARAAYGHREYGQVLQILEAYISPDGLFDPEYHYLTALCDLALAEVQMQQGDALAAAARLEKIDRSSIYYRDDMERRRRQLLCQSYEALEQHYKAQEDYQQAYLYACKSRSLLNR